ncbi:DinB family protein [Brevibacillus borstelensis]|uniref:DinB family protein n=1 Tax=Brevibacillus borstelensis TaxID=45462 RepID=UPI0030BCE013
MSRTAIDTQQYLNLYDQLTQAVDGLTEEALAWKESPEKWSITEVLSHLTDHNLVVSFRIREILSGSTAQLPRFSQDAWVSETKANAGTVTDILTVYQALLAYNSELFRRLSAEDWQKSGIQFNGKAVRLADVVEAFINHVQVHLAQIDRIKQAFQELHEEPVE